jgi:hypothetical protein
MAEVETQAEAEDDDVALDREVTVSRYADRDPVTVRTTHLDGEEPSREARILAGLRRLAREGRAMRDLEAELSGK